MRHISLDTPKQLLIIRFPYDEALVAVVRTLPERRWDGSGRYWTVPAVYADRVCSVLFERSFQAAPEVLALAGLDTPTRQGEPARLAASEASKTARRRDEGGTMLRHAQAYTVSQLNATARNAIKASLPRPVWLVGEVVGFARGGRNKAVYFELVEKADAGVAARVSAILWAADAERIRQTLARAADPFELTDDITVRVLVEVDLYTASGRFQVILRDIDPVYTLGEIAARREAILRALEAEGVATRNLHRPLPAVPQRIALLTSRDGEACRDVLSQLASSGLGFEVDLFDVAVQGPRLAQTVCGRLRALEQLAATAPGYDVVLIVRGGGSRTDLAWFDDLEVARAVCTSSLKIIVGIGHQRDQGVLDVVAHSVKTPTAAAQTLIEQVWAFLAQQDALWQRMRTRAGSVVQGARLGLREAAHRVSTIAARRVTARRLRLDATPAWMQTRVTRLLHRREAATERTRFRLNAAGPRLLARTQHDLQFATQRLVSGGAHRRLRSARADTGSAASSLSQRVPLALAHVQMRLHHAHEALNWKHPRRMLERGYARVRDASGQVVTESDAVAAGDQLVVELRSGRLQVLVQTVEHAQPSTANKDVPPDTDHSARRHEPNHGGPGEPQR